MTVPTVPSVPTVPLVQLEPLSHGTAPRECPMGQQQMARQRLPNRRAHELLVFEHKGHRYHGGIGRFATGAVAELFVNSSKVGSAVEGTAQEAALAVSLALQHGCPLETITHAMTRNGVALGPVGSFLLAIEAANE